MSVYELVVSCLTPQSSSSTCSSTPENCSGSKLRFAWPFNKSSSQQLVIDDTANSNDNNNNNNINSSSPVLLNAQQSEVANGKSASSPALNVVSQSLCTNKQWWSLQFSLNVCRHIIIIIHSNLNSTCIHLDIILTTPWRWLSAPFIRYYFVYALFVFEAKSADHVLRKKWWYDKG